MRDPEEAIDAAAEAIKAFGGAAELSLFGGETLSIEVDPCTGWARQSAGALLRASARVWSPSGVHRRLEEIHDLSQLSALLQAAARELPTGGAPPTWSGNADQIRPPAVHPERSRRRSRGALDSGAEAPTLGLNGGGHSSLNGIAFSGGARTNAQAVSSAGSLGRARRMWERLREGGVRVQSILGLQAAAWSAVIRAEGRASSFVPHDELWVRCETAHGAVVDGVGRTALDGWDEEGALGRISVALEVLAERGVAPNPSLPVLLRPAVAAPLVAALGFLLRLDIAAQSKALHASVGKKLFPGCLSIVDDPRFKAGLCWREVDDEGARAERVALVESGALRSFLSAGRSFWPHSPLDPSAPRPGPTNLFVAPRDDVPPAHCIELCARVETFTTMPKTGHVGLIAAGWELKDGERVRRIGPVDLELPLMATLRKLRGVGNDLTFFPTVEGVGTPSLWFETLF